MNTRGPLATLGALLLATGAASAQPPGRYATTPASLRAAPVFFHGKQIAVLGSITESRDLYRIEPTAGPGLPAPESSGRPIYVYWREQPSRTLAEIRGEFWDLGRLTEGDPRFSSYDFRPLLEATTQGRWPGRDQVFVILGGQRHGGRVS